MNIPDIKRIHLAINLEESNSLTNFRGKTKYFSEFLYEELQNILRYLNNSQDLIYDNTIFIDLLNLAKYYAQSDTNLRLACIQKLKPELINLEHCLNKIKQDQDNKYKQYKDQELWDIKVQWLSGVGPKIAENLYKAFGINNIWDLLLYFPIRHLDFSELKAINQLSDGDTVSIVAKVCQISTFTSTKNSNLNILNMTVQDHTGKLSISKFWAGKQGKYLATKYKQTYKANSLVIASGIVNFGKKTRYELKDCSLELIQANTHSADTANNINKKILAIYSLSEHFKQEYLRRIISSALENYSQQIPETLPSNILTDNQLIKYSEALQNIHKPQSTELLDQSYKRLAFEEFFFIQLILLLNSNTQPRLHTELTPDQINNTKSTCVLSDKFLELLPFELTNAQKRVLNEVLQDLNQSNNIGQPMNRLIQGDVGSGKTVIAILSMLYILDTRENSQASLMAPTEILAEQHYKKILPYMTELNITCVLLTGSTKTSTRRKILTDLHNGQVQLIIGTHALIQEDIIFHNLQLAIIDEQHRFGVKQREVLKNKSNNKQCDCLFMSATPIPRTMALILYGNLELSEIDELPPGRQLIKTQKATPKNRKKIYEFIRGELQEGRQSYIVYPLIDESESLTIQSVLSEATNIQNIFSEYKIGILHGKLHASEKDQIMQEFYNNNIQILISTTVIEVGVDVANASIMIIENAERFGLAQLHQLRGRVGRGKYQSYCFLISDKAEESERLEIIEKSNNGFEIAEYDLKLRGAGELLGTRQAGVSDFALTMLSKYGYLLESARQSAHKIHHNINKYLDKNNTEFKGFQHKINQLQSQTQAMH